MKLSNTIGFDYNQIQNLADLISFCNHYSKLEIYNLFVSTNGAYLAHNHGTNTPSSLGGIADVRRVYGAGLKVLSQSCLSVSSQTKYCAGLVLGHIKQYDFSLYSKADGIIAYLCYII